MYSSYLCLEAIILILLTHVGWYEHKDLVLQCSRDKSRLVKSIVNKKFIPILDRYRVAMPLDCPFHPQRDLLWWPETDDEAEDDDEISFQWTCPFCGSSFLCAERLAIHWDESHRFDIHQRDDAVCLSDFCDIMRCDVIIANKRKRRNRIRSQALSKIRRDFKNCNSIEMKKLESRCEQVVRQCTQGLLPNISAKDYRDIENDLTYSICSYLNCERYLDDYTFEDRNVPLTLCMVIGVIMIGGFCLCYYIVWMLFDSGYKSRTALMSRKPIEDESKRGLKWSEESNRDQSMSDLSNSRSEEHIPVSDRPKILITSPSTQRLIRSQPFHYYHPHQHSKYSSIEEDSWESCVDVSARTVTNGSERTGGATTAAVHSRPDTESRASSHTTSQSNQSNPYNS